MIYEFDGFVPVVHETAFVHPQAAVTGNVIIGADVYIGPGAAIRGDWGGIVIADGCNVQENCTVHMFPGVVVHLDPAAHIGHGAIIHGAHIGANALIGMNAVVMDNADVGEGCVVGALCFVPTGMTIPPRKVVVGNPAKIVKDVTDEMLDWKSAGTRLYQQLPEAMRSGWKATEPLRRVPANRPTQGRVLDNWQGTKNTKDSRNTKSTDATRGAEHGADQGNGTQSTNSNVPGNASS